jgi:hypothetical protein
VAVAMFLVLVCAVGMSYHKYNEPIQAVPCPRNDARLNPVSFFSCKGLT